MVYRSGTKVGEQRGRRVIHGLAQTRGLVGHAHGMQIDQAVDRLAAFLEGDPLHEGADVVAEVLAARRLDAREDPHATEASR